MAHAHGRRNFVDLLESFPVECEHVIMTLRDVYKNDAKTKEDNMSAEQRLASSPFENSNIPSSEITQAS